MEVDAWSPADIDPEAVARQVAVSLATTSPPRARPSFEDVLAASPGGGVTGKQKNKKKLLKRSDTSGTDHGGARKSPIPGEEPPEREVHVPTGKENRKGSASSAAGTAASASESAVRVIKSAVPANALPHGAGSIAGVKLDDVERRFAEEFDRFARRIKDATANLKDVKLRRAVAPPAMRVLA